MIQTKVRNLLIRKGSIVILELGDPKPSNLIASFDMDDTLIKPKSGAKFAKSATDWIWWHPNVPERLKLIA